MGHIFVGPVYLTQPHKQKKKVRLKVKEVRSFSLAGATCYRVSCVSPFLFTNTATGNNEEADTNENGKGFYKNKVHILGFDWMNEIYGKFVGRKPLFVVVAQHKEEKKAKLQVMLFFNIIVFALLSYIVK
ncbi:polyadenylate-binding protein [Trifolium repens]|nr:polyadenylate-binding protein [Trifolium repens]